MNERFQTLQTVLDNAARRYFSRCKAQTVGKRI